MEKSSNKENKSDKDANKEKNSLDNSLKLLVKTSFIVLIGLFISKVLAYVYRIIIARYFGPETYGLFSLAVMISSLFIAMASLGLWDGTLRYASIYIGQKNNKKLNYLFKISLFMGILSGIIFSIILFFSSGFISVNIFHNNDLTIFLKWFSILIPVSIIIHILLSFIRSYEFIGIHSFIKNIVSNVITVFFIIIFIMLGFKTNSIIFSYLLSVFFMLIFAYVFCKYKLPQLFIKEKLDKKENHILITELFSYSWPMMFTGIVSVMFYWIDSFSIGFFMNAQDVGFYNAATPIAILFTITSEIFMQLLFPLITKEYSANNIKFVEQITKQATKWIFIINLPVLFLMLLFPGAFINILFGPDYLVAINALRILAIGTFFFAIFTTSTNLLLMAGKSKIVFTNTLVFAMLNLFLNLILVPIYGINGAAFSTSLCYVFWGILSIYQAKKFALIIPFKRKMLKVFLISFIPLFLILFLRHFIPSSIISAILFGGLFLVVYFSLIFLTKCLDENDWMIINSIKSKVVSSKPMNLISFGMPHNNNKS